MNTSNKELIYKANTNIESTYRQVGKQFCFYLGRHIVYGLIHAYKFLAKNPVTETTAYCKLLELNHRVHAAYTRVLNDTQQENVKVKVTEIYEKLKTHIDRLKTTLYQNNPERLNLIKEINVLCLRYKDEKSVSHQIGTEVIASYIENFENDLDEMGQMLENNAKKHKQKLLSISNMTNIGQMLNATDQLFSAYQLCSLGDHYTIQINELREKSNNVTHPETAYSLREAFQEMKKKAEENFSILLELKPLPIKDEDEKNALLEKAFTAINQLEPTEGDQK